MMVVKFSALVLATVTGPTPNIEAFLHSNVMPLNCVQIQKRYSRKFNKIMNSDENLKNQDQNVTTEIDELIPPNINFGIFQGSSSTLFDENAESKANNTPLRLWKKAKVSLPNVVTGAWGKTSVGDDNPVGALYNIAFVRLPAIAMFTVYVRNLLQGHPLVMDVGYGTFQVSPIVVIIVFVIILGPGPQIPSQKNDSD